MGVLVIMGGLQLGVYVDALIFVNSHMERRMHASMMRYTIQPSLRPQISTYLGGWVVEPHAAIHHPAANKVRLRVIWSSSGPSKKTWLS